MNEKPIIEADDLINHNVIRGVAIICAPTGIICTVQAGGKVCNHPEIEGYSIPIIVRPYQTFDEEFAKFNDCSWGCCLIGRDGKNHSRDKFNTKQEQLSYLLEYGKAIDQFLQETINPFHLVSCFFDFDYERMEELMEGWWPVSVQFIVSSEASHVPKFKGYLHFGNCDHN